jgi:hypothetical protein
LDFTNVNDNPKTSKTTAVLPLHELRRILAMALSSIEIMKIKNDSLCVVPFRKPLLQALSHRLCKKKAIIGPFGQTGFIPAESAAAVAGKRFRKRQFSSRQQKRWRKCLTGEDMFVRFPQLLSNTSLYETRHRVTGLLNKRWNKFCINEL